jgi:hypothetical protein
VGRGIALLFHDCGTRRGWVVSSTPQLYFTPGKNPVPIVQAQSGQWKISPHRDSIPGPSSLELSRYTNWATRPTLYRIYSQNNPKDIRTYKKSHSGLKNEVNGYYVLTSHSHNGPRQITHRHKIFTTGYFEALYVISCDNSYAVMAQLTVATSTIQCKI